MSQKIVSFVVILAVLVCGAFAYASGPQDAPVLPTVAAVLPDPLPVDLAIAPTAEHPALVVFKPQAIKARPAAEREKAWTCGRPQGLASDETATVRRCEWL